MNSDFQDVKSKDEALLPPEIHISASCERPERKWQGIPGIERTGNGHLWVTFYSGGDKEGPDNYVLLVKSRDDGHTWSEPVLKIEPWGKVRAYDPCLWCDTEGRLWLFWAQSYDWYDGRCGVWAMVCEDTDAVCPRWSEPKRIANGIMMSKPTVLTTGEWLLPCAVWDCEVSSLNSLPEERFSNVYVSSDHGKSFRLLGGADVPNRCFDEHMVLERKDGSLWMLVRTFYGIGESVSLDRGRTWSTGSDSGIKGPNSRFFLRRLKSGRILLVNHYGFDGRNNLTAMLSEDEGATWKGRLVIDERGSISYPDGIESEDGYIYVVYDRDRMEEKEILMAVFTEEDVLNARTQSVKSRLKIIVNKAL